MEAEITYKLKERDFNKILDTKLEGIVKKGVLGRYRDRMISANAVAEIHGIHRDTVIKYARAKLIPHTHNNKLYKFSLADVLEFDFSALRRVG